MYTPPHVEPPERLPGVLGTLRDMRGNVLKVLPAAAFREAIVSGRIGSRCWHLVQSPEAMKRVFLEDVENYPKSQVVARMLRNVVGESLVLAEHDDWRWQRQAIAPVFAVRNMHQLAPVMAKSANRTAARLENQEQPVDITQEMLRATLEVICEVSLSGQHYFDIETYGAALTQFLLSSCRPSLLDFLGMPTWIVRPGEIRGRAAASTMRRMASRAIATRQANDGSAIPDLLDHMLSATDANTGRRMNEAELLHNLQFFIIAGHETTAFTLAWALYLLAQDEDAQAFARAESRTTLGNAPSNACITTEAPFVTKVFQEAMRLYPPVGLLARDVREPKILCGREIGRRDMVFANIYSLHRHERLWAYPNGFCPDHFTPDAVAARHRYQYLPFGGGPRICVGMNFAMMQARIMLTTLLSRFCLSPTNPVPTPVMHMTIRPEPGVFLICRRVGE